MQDKAKLVRKYYGIFLGLFTVAVGVLFIVSACLIFADGGYEQGAYSREIVGERFLYVCAPFFIWIAAIIAGFVLSIVFPYTEKKAGLSGDAAAIRNLRRLSSKIPEGSGESYDAGLKTVKRERLTRFITYIALAVICIACIIISAVFILNRSNFSGGSNNEMMFKIFKFVGPFILVAFACAVVAVTVVKFSIKKELTAVKSLISENRGAPVRGDMENPVDTFFGKVRAKCAVLTTKKASFIIRVSVIAICAVVGVTFIILGIFNEGVRDVLYKAIQICTECIGLG